MITAAFVARLQAAFGEQSDPARAAGMRAYQRGQFDFLGIQTPARRATVAQLDTERYAQGELLEVVRALWQLPQREFQYAGIDLLARRQKALGFDSLGPLLALAQCKPWWDTVDGLAAVIGRVIRAHLGKVDEPHAPMDAALAHQSMWVRRIAMLHQLGWRLQTDRERLFRYALTLAPEDEFFIRKAIGWALRDYARWDEEAVVAFVLRHRSVLSSLTVREALKHHRAALEV